MQLQLTTALQPRQTLLFGIESNAQNNFQSSKTITSQLIKFQIY